jgi:hypothetical protein
MFDRVVRSVEVVRERGEFGRNRIDLLNEGEDAMFLAQAAHGEFVGAETDGELAVRKAELL